MLFRSVSQSRYNGVISDYFGQNITQIGLSFVENKAVVVKLHDEFKDGNLQIGDVILAVNGIKVEDWIKNNLKYFPASNYPTQLRDISQRILRTNEQTISLTIENILGQKEVVVNTVKDKYFPNEVVSHKIINENIGYIYPGSLKKGEINEIMDKFLDNLEERVKNLKSS